MATNDSTAAGSVGEVETRLHTLGDPLADLAYALIDPRIRLAR